MLANISASEKAMELTLPASNHSNFYPCMGDRVRSNVESSQ
jgi:hypothetical protein